MILNCQWNGLWITEQKKKCEYFFLLGIRGAKSVFKCESIDRECFHQLAAFWSSVVDVSHYLYNEQMDLLHAKDVTDYTYITKPLQHSLNITKHYMSPSIYHSSLFPRKKCAQRRQATFQIAGIRRALYGKTLLHCHVWARGLGTPSPKKDLSCESQEMESGGA